MLKILFPEASVKVNFLEVFPAVQLRGKLTTGNSCVDVGALAPM